MEIISTESKTQQVFAFSALTLTRTVQPVATCRQSPYVHKPAIVKLLLLIYGFQFRSAFRATNTPSHAHFRHRHIPELICEINSNIDVGWATGSGSLYKFAPVNLCYLLATQPNLEILQKRRPVKSETESLHIVTVT